MSDFSEQVEASIVVADFVNVDQVGKANIIGGGIRVMPVHPETALTNPFGVLVTFTSPLAGDEAAFELLLTTATGEVVTVGGPAGEQAIRISQNILFPEPSIPIVAGTPQLSLPKGALPSNLQYAINFGSGLPLSPGNSYQFRAQLDHDTRAVYSFYVPKVPKPVLG